MATRSSYPATSALPNSLFSNGSKNAGGQFDDRMSSGNSTSGNHSRATSNNSNNHNNHSSNNMATSNHTPNVHSNGNQNPLFLPAESFESKPTRSQRPMSMMLTSDILESYSKPARNAGWTQGGTESERRDNPSQDDRYHDWMDPVNFDETYEADAQHVYRWFQDLSKPEKTAAICTLLSHTEPAQARDFFEELQKMTKYDPMGSLLSPALSLYPEKDMSSQRKSLAEQDSPWASQTKNSRHSFALGDAGMNHSNPQFHALLSTPSLFSSANGPRPHSWCNDLASILSNSMDALSISNDRRRTSMNNSFSAVPELDEQLDDLLPAPIPAPVPSMIPIHQTTSSSSTGSRLAQTLPPPPLQSRIDWGYRGADETSQSLLPGRSSGPLYPDREVPKQTTASSSASSTGHGSNSIASPPTPSVTKEKKPLSEDIMKLVHDMPAWLRSLRLHKYNSIFEKMRWQDMLQLTEEELLQMGVSALGARRKLLKVFAQVKEHCDEHKIPY